MTYAQLKALQAKGKYSNMDPKAFAALMGGMVGDPSITQSLADPSLLSQAEYGLNKVIDATGLPAIAGGVGGALFGETGEDVFRQIPRGAANLVPLAFSGPAGWAGAAAMGFSQGWGETEQFGPSAVSGAFSAAVPGIARLGGGAGVQIARRLGGTGLGALESGFATGAGKGVAGVAENLAMSNLPRTGGELAGRYVGEQAALLGGSVGADAASIGLDPNRTLDELATPEYWAAQAIGNLPFIGLDIKSGLSDFRAGKAEAAGARGAFHNAWLADQKELSSPFQERLALMGPTQDTIQMGQTPEGWASAWPPPALMAESPLANEQRQMGWDTEFSKQRLLQEAQTVRPFDLQTSDQQRGVAAKVAEAGETHIDSLPALNVVDAYEKSMFKTKLREELTSEDPIRVAKAVGNVLPDKQREDLQVMLLARLERGMDRAQAWSETLQIAKNWSLSKLSPDRKTDTLGTRDALDDTLSYSGRSTFNQVELNDWVTARQVLAQTDEKIKGELAAVGATAQKLSQQAASTGKTDRPANEIWSEYRKWSEKGGDIADFVKTVQATAGKRGIPDTLPRKDRPSPTNEMQVSREAMAQDEKAQLEYDEAVKAAQNDDPSEVSKRLDKMTDKARWRVAETIWPAELLAKPEYKAVLDTVVGGLRDGKTGSELAEALRMSTDPDLLLSLSSDADFQAGLKRALAANATDRKTLMKGLDGAVTPEMRAEAESMLQLKDILDAERKQPGVVDKMRSMLEVFGANSTEIARDLPTLARLWNFTKAFEGTDLGLMKMQGTKSMGMFASDAAGRRLVGAATNRPQMLSWIVAHELTGHGLWDAADKGMLSEEHTAKLNTFRDNVGKMTAEERSKMLQDAAASLPRHLRNDPEVQALLRTDLAHADPAEVLANANAIAALNLTSGTAAKLRDQIRYLPKWFGDMYDVAAHYMGKMYDVLRGLTQGKEQKYFAQHKRNLTSIMQESRANEVAAAQLALYDKATSPGGMRELLRDPDTGEGMWQDLLDGKATERLGDIFIQNLGGDDWKKVPHLVGAGAGRAGRWLAHTLQPIVQYGSADKDFRDFSQQQLLANQNVTKEIRQLMDVLGASYDGTFTKLGETGPESRLAKDDLAAEALNKSLLAIQKPRTKKGPDGKEVTYKLSIEQAIKAGDPDVVKHLAGLSNDQINLVLEAAANRELFHRTGMTKVHELNKTFVAAQAATTSMIDVTGNKLGLSYQPVYKSLLAQLPAYDALPRVDGKLDPAAQQAFEQGVVQGLVAVGHQPPQAMSAAASFTEMLKKADQVLARQLQHPGYINESRTGAYKVSFTVPKDSIYGQMYGHAEGEHGYVSAHSREEAEFLKKKYEDQGLSGVKMIEPTDYRAQEDLMLSSDIEDSIMQETDNLKESLLARGMDEKQVKEVLDSYNLLHIINRDKVAHAMGTLTVTRRFAPGRESLNMGEQQVQHVQSLMRGAQRRINASVFKGMDRDVKYGDSPEAAALMTSWRNNMMPDSQLTQGISKFGYLYALGLNMPNYAQEWVQGITGFPAKLIDEGASWAEAYSNVVKAQKDVSKMQLSNKFLKGGELDTSHLPADEAALIKDAIERGMMGDGMLSELSADTIDKQYMKQKIAFGWAPDTATSKTGQAADKVFHGITRLHSKFTAGSTSTALLAAYRHLKAKGLDNAAAAKQAVVLFNEGMMIGGRYNRPAGLWDVGSARPVAAMISSLQSFTSNTIASTINYARRAMDGKLPKGERQASAKALANQVLVQTALAGVMGLPLVGPLMALAEKSIGFDLQEEMAKMTAQLEDPIMAGALSQISLRGLSRGLGGPDIGARYGLGNVMGLNENDGFSFENFFGPVGSAAGRAVAALGDLAKGDPLSAAAQIAPVAIRKPLKMWSDGWQFRSSEGNLLLDNATAAEKGMYMLGLQPQRLSQAREAYNMTKRAREREHQAEIDFSKEVADVLQKGGAQEAQKMLHEAAVEGDVDYKDMVERVVNAIETRTFQARPTREGTKQTAEVDATIARGYGTQAPIDEVQREQFKAELAALLGVEPNEKRMHKASAIDTMRKTNPFLTVRQAKILLEEQERRSRGQSAGLQALLGQR